MTLIVEDGTGMDDAQSYLSVADANAYFTARGITSWTGSDTVKEQALIRATDYVDKRFQRRFVGSRSTYEQALAWPRDDAYSRDGFELAEMVPKELEAAIAEYALRALSLTLVTDPTTEATSGSVRRQRQKVGPLETETEYVDGANLSVLPSYPAADLLLLPILRRGAGTAIR